MTTKRTIVEMAYEEVSLAGYEFDVTPEELATGLRRLDALMAEWAPSYPLGYNGGAGIGNGDLDDPAGIPDWAVDISAKYLALRIMPVMAKSMDGPQRYALAAGLNALRARTTFIPAAILARNTVIGSGNRRSRWYGPFVVDDSANASPTLAPLELGFTVGAPLGLSFTTP